jgi:alcohol dehydrogenase class IV
MFSYQMGTRIEFGIGRIHHLSELLQESGYGKRVLLVTDPGVEQAGLVDPVLAQLKATGAEVALFNHVAQNPRDSDCEAGAEVFQNVAADSVIGIGGGSAMDTAKAIALLGETGGKVAEYVDGHRIYERVAPLVCIPTTAGTGSEVTRSAVITESKTHRKMTLKHALLRPALALLDPALTLSVPHSVTTATGVDALVHAIEGYTCKRSSPVTRAFGAAAMKVIIPALPTVMEHPGDIEARSDMLQGSLLAGLCFGASDAAAVHCLAEALGGLYDTPHGLANAVFLPHVLRFNVIGHDEVHAGLSRIMGFAKEDTNTRDAVESLVTGISKWVTNLGIPNLRELPGVRPEDFDELVELAYNNGSTPSNVRTISREDYRTILKQAYA